jgi:hypothetical protein
MYIQEIISGQGNPKRTLLGQPAEVKQCTEGNRWSTKYENHLAIQNDMECELARENIRDNSGDCFCWLLLIF